MVVLSLPIVTILFTLQEICADNDIAESAFESSHERFTFKHSFQTTKEGEVEFSVPERVKEIYDERSGNDFNDDLRDLLTENAYELDIEYEDNTYDSCDDFDLE
jgi:hypothetical protein